MSWQFQLVCLSIATHNSVLGIRHLRLEGRIAVSQPSSSKMQRLLDAFRHDRYPGGFPTARDVDAVVKRLMSEFRDWCGQQGLSSALKEAEQESAVLEAAAELEEDFGKLAAQGKARSVSVPKADGTIERRWILTSGLKAPPPLRPDTPDRN
jgi:hypothetical protein